MIHGGHGISENTKILIEEIKRLCMDPYGFERLCMKIIIANVNSITKLCSFLNKN